MKLSTAMMLGDTIMSRNPWTWIDRKNNCGCALGRAYVANGGTSEFILGKAELYLMWPWLVEPLHRNIMISTPFREVCEGKRTFEDLVESIAKAEPSCGDCNRFDCTCKPAAVPETEVTCVHA